MEEVPSRTDSVTLPRTKTRLVVLGDPHGDLLGLSTVLAREKRPEVALFSAGDNVGYSDARSSSELCRVLAREGIASVTGNHEAWSSTGKLFHAASDSAEYLAEDALALCRALPYRIKIACEAAPDLSVSLVHTLPDWEYVAPDNADRLVEQEGATVTFVGHSHSPAIYSVRDGSTRASVKRLHPKGDVPLKVVLEPGTRYVVDAGSLARPCAQGHRPRSFIDRGTYAALDLESRTLRVYSFDKRAKLRDLLARAIEENTRRAREGGG